MNVKSRYAEEEEPAKKPQEQYMRGMCGTAMNMGIGPGRVDVSDVHAPKFFEMIFKALGMKTKREEK